MTMRAAILAVWAMAAAPLFAQGPERDGYRLVWADEFNTDGRPDPANWTYERGFVRNRELQWYQPGNAICTNGLLVIEGRRERVRNPAYSAGDSIWYRSREFADYTAASLITRGLHSWQYGRFEVRARMLLNLAIGGAQGGDPSKTAFPTRFEIDHVRVYQKPAAPESAAGVNSFARPTLPGMGSAK